MGKVSITVMPQEHIDLIARHEQEFLAKRTRSERLGDTIAAFAESFGFLGLHAGGRGSDHSRELYPHAPGPHGASRR